MKRFRLRLSALLWLVAIVAAFLGGIRYGEYRAAAHRQTIIGVLPVESSVTLDPTTGP